MPDSVSQDENAFVDQIPDARSPLTPLPLMNSAYCCGVNESLLLSPMAAAI